MSEATKPAEAPKPKRCYPFVCVGQSILWYPSGKRTRLPTPAVVVEVGEKCLSLRVTHLNSDLTQRYDGVFHVDDPGANEHHRNDTGGWEHTAYDNALYAKIPSLGQWPGEK